jgi:hypothetical protein
LASDDPVFVIAAIGGAGKSALAWEWLKTRAKSAGSLWYSFYDGADMADFVAYASAYVTGRPLAEFRVRKVSELSVEFSQKLRERPFVFVLDGLERVLVGYHNLDVAKTGDEQVAEGSEFCDCVKPEDGEFLARISASGRSKFVVTSRLMPAETHQGKPPSTRSTKASPSRPRCNRRRNVEPVR